MILCLSSFITHDRPLNRHNRLDVLMMTLKSYSRFQWNEVNLFIKLDQEFLPFADELEAFINSTFPDTKLILEWDRFETQDEWEQTISRILKQNDFVWFMQNDDHPFIDIDISLIEEGLELLKSEKNEFSSIYLSHWPEALKLSGKISTPIKSGNFISFDATLLDAIQIFSPALLKYIFLTHDWEGRRFSRIDTILRQHSIWGESGNTDLILQKVYVPLREQCRKFMAYPHVSMSSVARLSPTFEISEIDRSPLAVKELMLATHESEWTKDNSFEIPTNWIQASQALYNNGPNFSSNL